MCTICLSTLVFLPLQSSLNGSASNLPDGSGRSFAASYSGQSGAPSPSFHHTGGCNTYLDTLVYFCAVLNLCSFYIFFMQEIFRDFIIFMGAIMSGTCKVHLHQETQV